MIFAILVSLLLFLRKRQAFRTACRWAVTISIAADFGNLPASYGTGSIKKACETRCRTTPSGPGTDTSVDRVPAPWRRRHFLFLDSEVYYNRSRIFNRSKKRNACVCLTLYVCCFLSDYKDRKNLLIFQLHTRGQGSTPLSSGRNKASATVWHIWRLTLGPWIYMSP